MCKCNVCAVLVMNVWVPGLEPSWRRETEGRSLAVVETSGSQAVDCKYLVPGAVTGDILCLTVMLRLPVLQI